MAEPGGCGQAPAAAVERVFAPDGPLARTLPGYAPRAQQLAMARAVQRHMAAGGMAAIEAGTGTGKTFAYLVPALLAGQRVVIATGTRHLQDQLFQRDLPLLRRALGAGLEVAQLKGRANYLCWHRLERARARSRAEAAELQQVVDWGRQTRSGDIAELATLGEDWPLWPRVTSTADNCLGGDCEHYQDCFIVRARRDAQRADLVIVNHHLLAADLALKEEGFGELLPGAEVFVVDEAHQLAEVIARFFGQGFSTRQCLGLVRDLLAEQRQDAPDMQDLADRAHGFGQAVDALHRALGGQGERRPWQALATEPAVAAALATLRERLADLRQVLETAAPRGKGLASCHERAGRLQERLEMAASEPPPGHVGWVESHRRSFSVHFTPVDVAPLFQEQLERLEAAWIFTSATLTVDGRFDYFCQRLGVQPDECLQLGSPFDYQRNSLLFLPPDMPDPTASAYAGRLVALALDLLRASHGRAFLLFTSHAALRRVAEGLAGRLPYPILRQGEAPRAELLRRFRELGNAVLLGTSSFWEGVDVRGPALSLVMIDRLPFASPADPVTAARIQALRAAGGNAFFDYQVPQAVIALKQGVGRLIRDPGDRGVLVLCDPRVTRRGYGRLFLDSLPPMRRVRDIGEVAAFFAREDVTVADEA